MSKKIYDIETLTKVSKRKRKIKQSRFGRNLIKLLLFLRKYEGRLKTTRSLYSSDLVPFDFIFKSQRIRASKRLFQIIISKMQPKTNQAFGDGIKALGHYLVV
jgi:hypothetical protein